MRRLVNVVLLFILFSLSSFAANSQITFFNNQYHNKNIDRDKIIQLINQQFQVNDYREIKVQVIYSRNERLDHLLVFLFSKKYHKVTVIRIDIDAKYNILSIKNNYALNAQDNVQQPGITSAHAKCPDPDIEFIAFAPNDIELEQSVTLDVAKAAEMHHLKTILLVKDSATRENYLNYMSCPKLKGNFYDGDANPTLIATQDGVITYEDIQTHLANQFRLKVVNYWLACEAFNDPIKSIVIDVAEAQKYAAGINDLLIGPSDYAAGCAMKAGIAGKPLTESFLHCYKKFDIKEDHWGFGGNGANFFGS